MKKHDIHQKWALVTGASSGLGVDFARELAARGANLVLVARRQQRLLQVAQELVERWGVRAEGVALDLSLPGAVDSLDQRLQELGCQVEILINNAGYGIYGPFLSTPWERDQAMLQLNLMNLVHLTKRLAAKMVGHGFGRILHVASLTAYQPTPTYACYGASKSFVLHFSQALGHELHGTGVTSTVLSPGATATEFFQVSGQTPTLFERITLMPSPRVARIGTRAMLSGRRHVIPGFFNALMAWLVRFSPRRLATHIAYLTMKQPQQPRRLP